MTVRLTDRQREVLARFLDGQPVRAIATELRCSPRTVRAHLTAAAGKIKSPHPPLRRLVLHGRALLDRCA